MKQLAIDFEYEIEIGGKSLLVQVESIVDVYRESYGMDIDGNRGTTHTVTEISRLHVYDSMGNEITGKIFDKYYERYETLAIEAEYRAFQEEGY